MKNKSTLKLLCLLLSFVMLLAVALTSCAKDDTSPEDSNLTSDSSSDTSPDSGDESDSGENNDNTNENGGENNGENNGGDSTTPENLDCIALTYGKYGEGAVNTHASSVYTIDNETGVVTVGYSSTQAWSATRYIFKAKFPAADKLPAKYRYVRVVYAAVNPEGSTPVKMILRNDGSGSGDDLVLDTVSEDTDGYVVSPTASLNVNLFQRYMDGNHNSLFFETAAEGGMYYIKGIYFFPSKEEADKMTAAYADKLLEDIKAEIEASKVPDGPTISMTFGTDGNAVLKSDNGVSSDTVNSDGAVEISYASKAPWASCRYRITPKFKTANVLTERYTYIRVLYSAQNPEGVDTVKMVLRKNADGSTGETVLNPTVQNTNGYSLTKTASFSQTILQTFMDCGDNGIAFITNAEGGLYKIKAIYFFTSEEAANAFSVEGVPVDKSIPFVMSFGTNGDALLDANSASNYTTDTDCVKISYSATTARTDSNYVLMPKFPTSNPDIARFKYIRVVYSATNPTGVNADMVIWNNASGQTTVLGAAVADTNGMAITDTVELKDEMGFMTRFATGGYNTVSFKTNAEGGEYSIYKIYFFDSEADADAFTLT